MMVNKKKKGFTLIELIVVICILGILAAILVPRFAGFTDKANKEASQTEARTILSAASAVLADDPTTAPTQAQIETLTGALKGTLAYTGTGDTITFTYDYKGYTTTVTDGVLGDTVKD